MNWTELLNAEVSSTYGTVEGLLDLVDDSRLDWRPDGGDNWMSTGQLLKHITTACGLCFQGFVTGDWGEQGDVENMPTSESMPAAASVEDARAELRKDRELASAMIAKAGEESLANTECPAPWDPSPMKLGRRLLQMVGHLDSHKSQLFYYLKLQGEAVHTGHFYGIEM